MERNTRVKKYKELRESMKEEVSIDRTPIIEDDDEEDDFLSFLPKEEEKEKDIDDTLNKPLSYETLDESEDVTEALNIAKMNVGKSQYDTRIDILNKIKNDQKVSEEEDYSTGYIVDGSEKNSSLMDKLASMSDDEKPDTRHYQKPNTRNYQEPEAKKEEPVKPVKETTLTNEQAKEELFNDEIELMEDYNEEDEQEESEPKGKGDILMTILNVIIIVLIVVFVFFIVLFLRQLFF